MPGLAADRAVRRAAPFETLTREALAPIVEEAIARWAASGLVDDAALATLDALTFEIADLSGLALGDTLGGTIILDSDAAGYGWFVDATASDDAEFTAGADGTLTAAAGSEACRASGR